MLDINQSNISILGSYTLKMNRPGTVKRKPEEQSFSFTFLCCTGIANFQTLVIHFIACAPWSFMISCFTGKFERPFSLKFGELRTLRVDEQWYSLGEALGMNIKELENIQKTEANVFKCKAQMFRLWLQNDQEVSWERLATALEEMNKTELATELRSHHCNDADIVSSGYGNVESSISWNKGSDENETDGLKHEIAIW